MFLRWVVICATLALSAVAAEAQTWPSHPIRLIVPNGPGLASDILARLFADRMSQTLGQQMYVENIPGASGITGAVAAARAAPDGYTFLLANASGLTSNMVLFKSLPYDPAKDFTPVALLTDSGPFVVAVNPNLPVKTLPELIAYGKANPGKLSYGIDATSGYGVVIGKLLNKRGGLGMVEIPYRSTPQLLADTAEGRTQLLISSLPASNAFAKSGKLRRIAVTSAKRAPGLDDVATIAETLPDFIFDGWFAIVAPAGTPADIVQRVNAATAGFLKDSTVSERLSGFTMEPARPRGLEETAAFIGAEQERWRKLAQEIDLQPQ